MIKKVFTPSMIKIVFVGGGNALNAVLGFLFLTSIARVLTLEDFGKYSILTSLLVSLSRLIDFGTNSTYVANSLTEVKSKINDALISTRILLFMITIPVFWVIAKWLDVYTFWSMVMFLLGLSGYFLNYVFYAYFQKDQEFLKLVLLNLFPAIIKGVFGFLIIFGLFEVTLISGFSIFSLAMLTSFIFIPFLSNEHKKFKVDFSGTGEMLKQATPAGISQLVAEGWPALNNGIAKIVRGFSDVGVFSLANKISTTFSLISFSIFTVLLPKSANLKRQHKKYDFKETYILSAGVLLLTFAAIIFAKYFVPYVFGEKFIDSLKILNILIFASAFSAIHNFMENYFYVEKKTNYILYINSFKLVLFILIVFILTGMFSLVGLALANLISSIGALFATYYFIKVNEKQFILNPAEQESAEYKN